MKKTLANTDLWDILEEEWNRIPNEYIKNLYKSMSKRINLVKISNFDKISY